MVLRTVRLLALGLLIMDSITTTAHQETRRQDGDLMSDEDVADKNLNASNLARPVGWSYKGCYIDQAQGRILEVQQPDNATLSVESCIDTCNNLGYSIAGVEWGVQCFCDTFIRNGGVLASAASDCNMPCAGNANQTCGAGSRLDVYSNSTLGVYRSPAVQKTGLPGYWNYSGCMSDTAGAPVRTLLYQTLLEKNNTPSACLAQCAEFRYNAAGMQYGRECWCGDIGAATANGGRKMPESDCNMPCSGNSSYLCGAGNRLQLYTWQSSNAHELYEWNYPTGQAAGKYEFYVPGVVVPLITTLGVNGKITFLEKSGTGPPNTTGVYELDPSLVDAGGNWTAAWRPMHVSSDIFCSASLTLPDKAGRQINIGGWANEATHGVRLYWPDGQPSGVSRNDWHEKTPDISLQKGRWYPTAMLMTNGSILVVGGQDGSNGRPVPSLELLPKVGPVITLDFLQRTDPYNLYPFLAALPSGGIFIAYYNEARILSDKDFSTTKTLSNIPGAVNNFLGGRSYPFSGTMVLLPQAAPYTEPLTILICGGTIPGPEFALDNCVSTQPEADTPVWTIERMPSKRVISCMTALPDGSFLISNGAFQGRAGFGLANDPNLNAILYDPSKSVHHRMSVLANTTVARLYHSEAILMQDGRVLISGSDPENVDNKYPQEYRVEVFTPPYLMTGAARPEFTITDRDWSYGGRIRITVIKGDVSRLKVTLTAFDSSTHGSSMGQRTLFPKFSCSGTTCTITAPPDSRVSPPGWWQLWVLDAGVPSRSTIVRIGGDPGRLGNWPAVGGFSLPGM